MAKQKVKCPKFNEIRSKMNLEFDFLCFTLFLALFLFLLLFKARISYFLVFKNIFWKNSSLLIVSSYLLQIRMLLLYILCIILYRMMHLLSKKIYLKCSNILNYWLLNLAVLYWARRSFAFMFWKKIL